MSIAYFQLYDRFLMITEEWNIYNITFQPSESQSFA